MSIDKRRRYTDSLKVDLETIKALEDELDQSYHVTNVFEKYEQTAQKSKNKQMRMYIWNLLGIIGQEFEEHFSDFFTFDNPDKTCRLIGREKSDYSLDDKAIISYQESLETLENETKTGTKEEISYNIEPIFDTYAFRFVSTHVDNPTQLVCKVLIDFLTEISNDNPSAKQEADSLIESLNSCSKDLQLSSPDIKALIESTLDFISKHKPKVSIDLKKHMKYIFLEQLNSSQAKSVIDMNSSRLIDGISDLTYEDYYSMMIACKTVLKNQLYNQNSSKLRTKIQEDINTLTDEYNEAQKSGKLFIKIHPDDLQSYKDRAKSLIDEMNARLYSRLDMYLGSLAMFDFLNNSKRLQQNGIKYNYSEGRTKYMTTRNCYESTHHSIELPYYQTSAGIVKASDYVKNPANFGTEHPFLIEIQCQSQEGYERQSVGTAAHKYIDYKPHENPLKKLLTLPKEKKVFKRFFKRYVPKFANYMNRHVVYNDKRSDLYSWNPIVDDEDSEIDISFRSIWQNRLDKLRYKICAMDITKDTPLILPDSALAPLPEQKR